MCASCCHSQGTTAGGSSPAQLQRQLCTVGPQEPHAHGNPDGVLGGLPRAGQGLLQAGGEKRKKALGGVTCDGWASAQKGMQQRQGCSVTAQGSMVVPEGPPCDAQCVLPLRRSINGRTNAWMHAMNEHRRSTCLLEAQRVRLFRGVVGGDGGEARRACLVVPPAQNGRDGKE